MELNELVRPFARLVYDVVMAKKMGPATLFNQGACENAS